MNKILPLFLILSCGSGVRAHMQTNTLTFSFEGKRMSGFIDMPTEKKASALIVFVPGYGNTNAAEGDGFGNGFHRLRTRFAAQGIACLFWDKSGCGNSEGVFDPNQPVQNEASEVIAAITEVKARNVPGTEKIGLWVVAHFRNFQHFYSSLKLE